MFRCRFTLSRYKKQRVDEKLKIQVWDENFSCYHQQELGIIDDTFGVNNFVSITEICDISYVTNDMWHIRSDILLSTPIKMVQLECIPFRWWVKICEYDDSNFMFYFPILLLIDFIDYRLSLTISKKFSMCPHPF